MPWLALPLTPLSSWFGPSEMYDDDNDDDDVFLALICGTATLRVDVGSGDAEGQPMSTTIFSGSVTECELQQSSCCSVDTGLI